MTRLALLVVLLGAGPLLAQVPNYAVSHGFLDCRWWQEQASDMKLGYIVGHSEAVLIYANQVAFNSISSHATHGEYRDGVDELCKAPENGLIPIYTMLQIFAAKFRGEAEAQINERLASARRFYNTAPRKTGGAK